MIISNNDKQQKKQKNNILSKDLRQFEDIPILTFLKRTILGYCAFQIRMDSLTFGDIILM